MRICASAFVSAAGAMAKDFSGRIFALSATFVALLSLLPLVIRLGRVAQGRIGVLLHFKTLFVGLRSTKTNVEIYN